MSYKDAALTMKNVNILDVGILYKVRWDELEEQMLNALADYEGCLVDSFVIEENNLWDYSSYFATDELERETVLNELIKDSPHYLVMAHNCRWNGASGFIFVDDKKQAFYRDHEASIFPVDASTGGKTLICSEFSHDVPMGARTSVIALTDREYLNLKDADWDTVNAFVERQEARV